MTVDTVVRIRTCAKVNLFLRVLGIRPDGFHEVETILHGIGLYDEIDITPTDGDISVDMSFVDGVGGALPDEPDNLVRRAAEALRGDRRDLGAHILVRKGVPIAAGLGGGSANAAGVLETLSDLWGLDMTREQLFSIAETLGSDVPYCLEGGTVLATARGEQLTPLAQIRPIWFVLAGTAAPLFTGEVYSAWDRLPPAEETTSAAMAMALGAGDTGEVATVLWNELEPAAFLMMPELEGKKRTLIDAGALGACMSGSGPTMYAVASDEDDARSIAAAVEDRFDWIRVVSSENRSVQRLDGR